MHSKKRVKHYSGEKCISRGIKHTIFYIKVYENRCVSVQVPATNRKISSYSVRIRNSVNIIHL